MNLVLSWGLVLAVSGWAQTQIDLATQTKDVDFTSAAATKPVRTGTTLPATCGVAELFLNLNAPSGAALYVCLQPNTWTAEAGTAGGGAATGFSTNIVATLPATCGVGDTRFAPDATLSGGGFYLYMCTSANTWNQFGYEGGNSGALAASCSTLPCTIDVTNIVPLKAAANTWSGANDFSAASMTAPFRIVTADPAACNSTSREFILNTSSGLLKSCTGTNTWVPMGAVVGPALTPGKGYFAPYGFPGAGNTAVGWNTDGTGLFACTQFVAPFSMTLTKVGVIVGTGPAAGKGFVVGYMDSNFNTLAQGTLVAPGGSGNAVVPFGGNLVLSPGVFYQCVGSEDVNVTLVPAMSGTAAAGFSSTLNNGTSQRVVVCSNAPTGTGSSYALPSTCGTATAKSYPVVSSLLLP